MTGINEATSINGADRRWHATADEDHASITGMFGGWTAAVLLRAAMSADDGGVASMSPSAMTVNYVRKIEPGADVVLDVVPLGGGRSIRHVRVDAISGPTSDLAATALVTLTARRPTRGNTEPARPDAPPPDLSTEFRAPLPQGLQTLIHQVSGFPPHDRTDTESVHWIAAEDGDPLDHPRLAYLADQTPPRSFFWHSDPTPSATVTMSVHFHASPEEIDAVGSDPLLVRTIGTRGHHSTSGHHMELWGPSGDLLATSEQLCWYRSP